MKLLALTTFALIAPLQAAAPSPQASAIAEGLDLYCLSWLDPRAPAPTANPRATAATGWREQRSAAPAVGPILIKGGTWGNASLVRVDQASGRRCSIAIQLAADRWTTDTAYEALGAWAVDRWPDARLSKTRGEGPRGTRETVWMSGSLTLTLQEAPGPGAQPNVFISVQRAREI